MLSRLYYVTCDECGLLCSEGEWSGAEARAIARRRKWFRVPHTPDSRGADYCRPCARKKGLITSD